MSPSIWSILGVKASADRSEIRRAYAERLRATHPEDDPEGFKALRAAYEAALQLADRRELATAQRAAEASPEPLVVIEGAQEPSQPVQAPGDDPVEAHWALCQALVDALQSQAPDVEVRAAFNRVLASAGRQTVSVYAETAVGLARVLLQLAPAGDALIEPTVSHFQWRGRGELGQHAEVVALLEREAMLQLRAHLRDGPHQYHRAYKALTAAPPRWGYRPRVERVRSVRSLLNVARGSDPWLLSDFRPPTVEWWDRCIKRAEARGRQPLVLRIVIRIGVTLAALAFLSFLASVFDKTPSVTTSSPNAPAPVFVAANDAAGWAKLCADAAHGRGWSVPGLQDCDKALEMRPDSVETRLDSAYLYLKADSNAVADSDFQKVQARQPQNAAAIMGRALIHSMAHRDLLANREIARARKLDPRIEEKVQATYGFTIVKTRRPAKP